MLNFARSCRGVDELLLPCLYRSFSVSRVYDKFDMAMRWGHQKHLPLPYGLASVQELDVRIRSGVDYRPRLTLACKNVVRCDLAMFYELLCREEAEFPRLEILDLGVDDSDGVFDKVRERAKGRRYKGMPNLRALNLKGDVKLVCTGRDLEVAGMPERFVAKIRDFGFLQSQTLADVVAFFPSFAPERIVCPCAQVEGEHWNLLCGLPFLKRLELGDRHSYFILRSGFPPNLEFFSDSDLEPTLCWDEYSDFPAALKKLGELVSLAQASARFQLGHEARPRPYYTNSDAEFL